MMVKIKSSLALKFICHGCLLAFSFVNKCDLCHSTKLNNWSDGLYISENEINNIHVQTLSEHRNSSYEDLVKLMPKETHVILIGEGTHGTQEFFEIREEITKCLLENHGYEAVFFEGERHPFLELNAYTTSGTTNKYSYHRVRELLSELFSLHFPDWMWCNIPMADFVSWVKTFNDERNTRTRVQLIGMDIQDPFDPIDFVVDRLAELGEHELSAYAADRYATLRSFSPNIRKKYGDAFYGNRQSSQETAVKQVLDVLMKRQKCDAEPTAWFQLLESARTVVASESYHRQRIFPGHVVTWNLRSTAFLNTIQNYFRTQEKYAYGNAGESIPKFVVWAHNSHVGDISATDYASTGQINLGQLCRDRFGRDSVFVIGMTTHEGTVRAANADSTGGCWHGDGQVHTLKSSIEDSHESVLQQISSNLQRGHAYGVNAFGMSLGDGNPEAQRVFGCNRFERFVGSCYLKNNEMVSHYQM